MHHTVSPSVVSSCSLIQQETSKTHGYRGKETPPGLQARFSTTSPPRIKYKRLLKC